MEQDKDLEKLALENFNALVEDNKLQWAENTPIPMEASPFSVEGGSLGMASNSS